MTISVNEVNRRQLLRGSIALFATVGCSQVGLAAAIGKQSARALVSGLVGQILEVISAGGQGADREGRLMAAIESQTDLSLLARMTMGRYWRRATVRQREAFVDVFGRYLLSNFTSRLRHYAGADLGAAHERFKITGTKSVGKNDVVVRSRVTPPRGAPLAVDWRVRAKGDRLFIIDLVVEGVSLLVTQRSEFGSVLERIGIDGLIGELQTRVARST